jgi:hypothetical protein
MIKNFKEFSVNESMDEERASEEAASVLQQYSKNEVSEEDFDALKLYVMDLFSQGKITTGDEIEDYIRDTITNTSMFNRVRSEYGRKD